MGHLLLFTEDLKVKATGCGTGFGFSNKEIEAPCPQQELGRLPSLGVKEKQKGGMLKPMREELSNLAG